MADKPDNRLARELESRETTQRKKAWTPPQILPEPKPIPGFAFRWIRTAIMGQFDPTNTSAKLREGWEPCKAEDHPEMMLYADPNSRFKGNVEVGGLMLCKAPEEMVRQRADWFNQQSKSQVESVDNNFMKTNDPRMPLFNERKSTTSFGRGSR
jgi:hypothetical protein